LKSPKGFKRKNSYVACVFRRVPNSRYTKFGLNRLRGQRVNFENTDRHTFAFIYKKEEEEDKNPVVCVTKISFSPPPTRYDAEGHIIQNPQQYRINQCDMTD
jgi:hypothetical protein